MAEQLTREEALQFLTMQKDKLEDLKSDSMFGPGMVQDALDILLETGNKIGYAPTMRCLVAGLDPEQSIRWGK